MDPEQKTTLYVIECIDLIDFSFYSTYNSLSSFVVIMNENSIFKSGSIVARSRYFSPDLYKSGATVAFMGSEIHSRNA